jgi:hypothetical protein
MSDLLARITINPKQCSGRPCIRGMRIRVSDVLDLSQIILLTGGNTSNDRLKEILTFKLSEALNLLSAGEPLVEISGN